MEPSSFQRLEQSNKREVESRWEYNNIKLDLAQKEGGGERESSNSPYLCPPYNALIPKKP